MSEIKSRTIAKRLQTIDLDTIEGKELFHDLVQNYKPVSIAEMMGDKKYSEWFNDSGEIFSRMLGNELAVYGAKDGDSLWMLGDRLNYMQEHNIFEKLGFASANAYFNSKKFPFNKTHGFNAMGVHHYFDRLQAVALRYKAVDLLPIVNKLAKDHKLKKSLLRQIMSKVLKLNDTEFAQFVKDYMADLRAGTEKDLREYDYNFEEDESGEIIIPEDNRLLVDYDIPVKVQNNIINIDCSNGEEWEQELAVLAFRRVQEKIKDVLKHEMDKMLDEDEFQNYRKMAIKKFQK